MKIIFDTETVGLPKNYKSPLTDLANWPRMVQLAFIVIDDEQVEKQSYCAIVKPEGFEIPKEASDLHGITTERALEEGKSLSEVLQAICTAMNECDTLIAHNMTFDEKILGAEMIRANIFPEKKERKKICTMEASTNFCAIEGQYGFKWPKLQELHKKLFDCEFEGAHDALNDVNATKLCYWALVAQGVIK